VNANRASDERKEEGDSGRRADDKRAAKEKEKKSKVMRSCDFHRPLM